MKWDRYGMRAARFFSKESEDPHVQVGAAILRPNGQLASEGWNGLPRRVHIGFMADRERRRPWMVHAEMNALLGMRESAEGYSIYIYPLLPCSTCAGAIIQAGITRVVTAGGEYDTSDITLEMFRSAGVELVTVNIDGENGNEQTEGRDHETLRQPSRMS